MSIFMSVYIFSIPYEEGERNSPRAACDDWRQPAVAVNLEEFSANLVCCLI